MDGGYRVSGRWGWGSTVQHSQWVIGGSLTPDGPRLAVYPRSDVTIHDTWYVSGLCATGSHEFSVTDAFVPAARTALPGVTTPGTNGPLPHFPFFCFLATGVASVGLGVARRAIDEIVALAVENPQRVETPRRPDRRHPDGGQALGRPRVPRR
ncbi:hypothetical protein GCM10022267_59730 [Lentzea roselyniae]|uniref:Uncharacterized protein n=1 Tax=Lentzea roselyniae TaxID=531940 RepID=A0ABP7BQY5_9PSEU